MLLWCHPEPARAVPGAFPAAGRVGRGQEQAGKGQRSGSPQPRTLAWCRSTPYMESFLAFSRKWISASPGVIPLQGDREGDTWPGAPGAWGSCPVLSPPGAHR